MTPSSIFTALSVALPAVLVNGRTGEIQQVSLACAELVGWKSSELVGQQLDVLIPERSRVAHHVDRTAYMRDPTARPMGPDRQVLLLCRDGSEVVVWIGLTPLGDDLVAALILPIGGASSAETLNP